MAIMSAPAASQECGTDAVESADKDDLAWLTRLSRTIEGEIIPRLLLAHKNYANPILGDEGGWAAERGEVEMFGTMIIAAQSSAAFSFIETSRRAGRPLEDIIVKLLAPTARHLGELWKADRCSFTEVTIGLSRLRQILRELEPEFESEKPSSRHGRRLLLAPVPGEQHTFGICVVEAFFRREGWDVFGGPVACDAEIVSLVEKQWFAIAGFSLGAHGHLKKLPPLIAAIRRKSCNPGIVVLVGGPLFLANPDLAVLVGADGSAADGRDAVIKAGALLSRSHHKP